MNTIRITTVAISLLLGSIAFKANAQNTTEKIQKQNRTKPILLVENLQYIENIKNPEDLVQIPNSKWIIASGMAPKSGLHLIDTETKTAQRWFAPKASSPNALYPESEPQPDADEMQIHGISLRKTGKNKFLLYAVNHNGADNKITRETIEIFQVDAQTTIPTLTWLGNVRMPNDFAGNGVVSGADGSIYVTVMTHPEHTLDDMFSGKITGAVYRWTPTTRRFEKLIGTEFSGNNGIELSKDEKFIYIAHMTYISKVTNTNPAKVVATAEFEYGGVDNIHWHGKELIAAGSMQENCGEKITFDCLKDFHITKINPRNLKSTTLIKGKYTDKFSGVSSVLPVGKTYYIGSFYRDRLAYFEIE